jgi:AraC-like DNA-binding protein
MRQLPPQLFGARTALTVSSVNQMQDLVANLRGWRGEYGTQTGSGSFACKTSVLNVNGTKLTNVVHTPMTTWVQSDHSSTLFVPLTGAENCSRINGKDLRYAPGQSAAFAPEGVRIGEGGLRSILMIDVDKQRLRDTASAMAGEFTGIPGDLNAPMAVSLRAANLRFDQMLRHICSMADQLAGTPSVLNRSGLADVIYRTMAMLFVPTALHDVEENRTVDRRAIFLRLRDYLLDNLCEPITLTDLERKSGASARTLQYVFKSETGLSPMAWLKQQRLLRARQMLHCSNGVVSLTALALDLAFSSPSRFAAEYRQQFGCRPSEDWR